MPPNWFRDFPLDLDDGMRRPRQHRERSSGRLAAPGGAVQSAPEESPYLSGLSASPPTGLHRLRQLPEAGVSYLTAMRNGKEAGDRGFNEFLNDVRRQREPRPVLGGLAGPPSLAKPRRAQKNSIFDEMRLLGAEEEVDVVVAPPALGRRKRAPLLWISGLHAESVSVKWGISRERASWVGGESSQNPNPSPSPSPNPNPNPTSRSELHSQRVWQLGGPIKLYGAWRRRPGGAL